MQGPGQTAQARGERIEDIGERRANEVRRVRADIAGLVIGVQDEVQAREIGVALAVCNSHHAREVQAVVLSGVVARLGLLAEILVAIDERSDDRQFGGQVQAVLQRWLPIHILLHARVVLAVEGRVRAQRQHCLREQDHRVGVLRHGLDHLVHVVGHIGAPRPLCLHLLRLLSGRHFADHEQVVQTAHQRHLAAAGLGQCVQDLGDGHAAEADAFGRVDVGHICKQRLDVAHTADDLAHGDLVDHHIAVFLGQGSHALPPFGDLAAIFSCRIMFLRALVCSAGQLRAALPGSTPG